MSGPTDDAIAKIHDGIAGLRDVIDGAYTERNALVRALTKVWPSYLARHPEGEGWDPEWMWIVFVDSPAGQLCWHVHAGEVDMFDHLEVRDNNWDGHTTDQKYARLASL